MAIRFKSSKLHHNETVVKDPDGKADVEFGKGTVLHSNKTVVDASRDCASPQSDDTNSRELNAPLIKWTDLRTQILAILVGAAILGAFGLLGIVAPSDDQTYNSPPTEELSTQKAKDTEEGS